MRHLLSLIDVGPEEISRLVDHSLLLAGNNGSAQPLKGKTVGIYFRRASTRTRTAFTTAAIKLGGTPVAYGPNDLQISTGETIEDTARVLSGYLDALVIRTNESIEEMRTFASQNDMAIVNAMSDTEHPTQALADLVTIKEAFGRLNGIKILYLGEGNNTASALAFAVSMTEGMRLLLITPEGYGLPSSLIEQANELGRSRGSLVEQHHDMAQLPHGFDVVYTTRWQTMGESKTDPNWKEKFIPYRVTQNVMQTVSNGNRTIFMHDLPAVRGDDVVNEVLDGPQSVAFRQARHKLSSAMAVLSWCIGETE
jgi:ornithine carbamoyltransferase